VNQEILASETLTVEQESVPVHAIRYGPTQPLPPPQTGVLLVVPRVLARESDRTDLLFPDEEIRDPEGRIIGCMVVGASLWPVDQLGEFRFGDVK